MRQPMVFLVCMTALLGAEVSTRVFANQQPRMSDSPDVCVLLPREEATKILGRNVRARSVKRSDGPMECRYAGGLDGSVTVMVGGGTPKAKWDAFMKELRASGAMLEAVAGVGDGAYFWDDRLYTHIGNFQVTVSTTPFAGAKMEKTRADAVALGKAIVAKLKE